MIEPILALGQRVRFSHSFKRLRPVYDAQNDRTIWPEGQVMVTSLWRRCALGRQMEGIVTGIRRVQDVKTWNSSMEGKDPEPLKTHTVYLVVFSLYRNPIHVLGSDLEVVP